MHSKGYAPPKNYTATFINNGLILDILGFYLYILVMIKKLSDEEIKNRKNGIIRPRGDNRFPVEVVAENIRSLYNVGSIFRTSDGAFIEKLWLTGYTGFPPRKEIDKTALGAVESVPWERADDTVEVLQKMKREGKQIISLEHTDKSVPYNKFEYEFPLCIVMGNEVDGISHQSVSGSDYAIDIPMHGIKQSLNVAVAYGVIIYHIIELYKTKFKIQGGSL